MHICVQHTCIHACLRTYGCVHVSCYKAAASKLITVLECESTRPHALLSDLPYRCLHRHTPENTLALCLQHTCMPAYIHRTYMQHACMHTYIHTCRHTYAHQITNPCATSTAAVSLFLHSMGQPFLRQFGLVSKREKPRPNCPEKERGSKQQRMSSCRLAHVSYTAGAR